MVGGDSCPWERGLNLQERERHLAQSWPHLGSAAEADPLELQVDAEQTPLQRHFWNFTPAPGRARW